MNADLIKMEAEHTARVREVADSLRHSSTNGRMAGFILGTASLTIAIIGAAYGVFGVGASISGGFADKVLDTRNNQNVLAGLIAKQSQQMAAIQQQSSDLAHKIDLISATVNPASSRPKLAPVSPPP